MDSRVQQVIEDLNLNPEQAEALIRASEQDVQDAKPKARVRKPIEIRISEKGCVSLVGEGLRIRGAHFYPGEWVEMLRLKDEIYNFIIENAEKLSFKDRADRDKVLDEIAESL